MSTARRALQISILCAVLILGSAAVGQRRYARPGPDSFLAFPVESTRELAAALRSDPALRARYARHFGAGEAEVIGFVERALVPYRLPQSRTLTVYGVTRSGRIYPVRTRLRRGTRVWATRSGVPILKWLCSNPLTRSLPGLRLPAGPRTAGQAGFRGGAVTGLPMAPATFDLTRTTPDGLLLATPPPVAGPVDLTRLSLEDLMDVEFKPEPLQRLIGPLRPPGIPTWGILGLGALSYTLLRGGRSGGQAPPVPPAEIPEPGTPRLIAAGMLAVAAMGALRRGRAGG
jgi:hypothetical protein